MEERSVEEWNRRMRKEGRIEEKKRRISLIIITHLLIKAPHVAATSQELTSWTTQERLDIRNKDYVCIQGRVVSCLSTFVVFPEVHHCCGYQGCEM